MSRTAPDHAVEIAQALATEGGHLFIGPSERPFTTANTARPASTPTS